MTTTTPDTADTITLRNDGSKASDEYTLVPRSLPSLMYDDIGEKTSHSIVDFLSRYVIVSQGNWQSSAVRGAVLANLTFPKQLFNTGAYSVTQNVNKLDGFVGLKARVRVRIEVNSQPFQAGALMLHFVPYSEYMNSHTQWYSTATVTDTVAASGCAHVVMNLANNTSMEFCSPYISPYLFFNLPTGQGSFGNIVISVLSPLSSGVASTASYTIWAKFEDIDLRFPTDAPLTTNFAQIGTELSTMESRGTISGTVGSVGRAISSVLPWVGLGWLSSPVESLSDGAEKVLKHLGFSKPAVEAPVTRIKNAPTQYFLNHDGADTSHKLALSAENALTQYSGWAGTDIDEMRLDYIASRPCYTTAFNWTTTQAADLSIFLQPVSPMWQQTTAAAVANAYARITSMPLCARVASFFSLWRGTMVFRFHVVKTQFHSGRLRVSFRPYVYTDNSTIQNMPAYSYTEELDLSAGTDFTFKVPFTSVRPWLHTYYDVKTSLVSGDARNTATGVVQVSIINPLVAAPTVSNTIEILCFTYMEDAQFGAPIRPPIAPFGIPNVAQIGKPMLVPTTQTSDSVNRSDLSLLPYSTCVGEVAASLRQLLKRFSLVARVQLGTSFPPTATQPGSSCNGVVLFPWAPVIPQGGNITVNAAGVQSPAYPNQYQYNASGSQTNIFEYPDAYSHIYSMFAFFRGSIRYKIAITYPGANYNPAYPVYVYINNVISPALETWSPSMQITPSINSTPATNLGTGPVQPLLDLAPVTTSTLKTGFAYQPGLAEARMIVFPDKEGMIEFEVPFHATGPFCPTNYGQNNPTNARSIFTPFPTVTITGVSAPTGSPASSASLAGAALEIFRAVGDDFSFGGLLGAPNSAIWYSGVAPT